MGGSRGESQHGSFLTGSSSGEEQTRWHHCDASRDRSKGHQRVRAAERAGAVQTSQHIIGRWARTQVHKPVTGPASYGKYERLPSPNITRTSTNMLCNLHKCNAPAPPTIYQISSLRFQARVSRATPRRVFARSVNTHKIGIRRQVRARNIKQSPDGSR